MKKCLFRFLLFTLLFIFINNDITTREFDPSLSILLFENTCVFVDDNSNIIYKQNVNENDAQPFATIQPDFKNKMLIKISNEKFVLFALNNSNCLFYFSYNINDENQNEIFDLNFPIDSEVNNYTIKSINESSFLLYYIKDEKFYLYLINQSLVIEGNNPKNIKIEYDYHLNTIECDSYDGINIFCAYSTYFMYINYNNGLQFFATDGHYSFGGIEDDIGKDDIKNNIGGPALLKIETNNQKKFLMCYYEPSNEEKINPSTYCQFFTQIDNKIIKDSRIIQIGTAPSPPLTYLKYTNQNVLQLFNYEYTIYINLKLKGDGNQIISMIYVASIDLNLIVPYYLNSNAEKINILLSDQYILFLTKVNSIIKIEPILFPIQCPKNKDDLY